MSEYTDLEELRAALRGVLEDGQVKDAARLRETAVDRLAWTAVFAADERLREEARRALHQAADGLGCPPASIQPLYEARGRRACSGFTVPAVNIRGMTYDVARALFRAMKALECGATVFEIARSEIGYTEQRPGEYAAVVLAAAVREGHEGPVFIQGDHFQASAKKYAADPEAEIAAIRKLTEEAVLARFLNIDIDMSTLVDLSKPTVREQQRVNFTRGAELTALIRSLEPEGVTVSVGGEIGEVGGKNSTVEELRAYMDGFLEELARRGEGLVGISKISVQTGTSHGGVPLPDGSVAQVAIDFDVLRSISEAAIDEYGLAGCVQHGASTLPEEAFDRFPATGTAEIHLATGFQNLIYDHPAFPAELKRAIYAHLDRASADERKPGQTDEQFYYKTRKKGFGPFKRDLWSLGSQARGPILAALEERFKLLMGKLGVSGSRDLVRKHVG
jgi:fructose/tagatose bisphosphate aldolase